MHKIHEELQELARKVFAEPTLQITDDMTAKDVERWDSLTHIAFIVAVEKHFAAKFKNAEIARLLCIGDLKKLIAKRRPELASAA